LDRKTITPTDNLQEKSLEEKLFRMVLLLSIATGLFWIIYRLIFFKSINIILVNSLSTVFFITLYWFYRTKGKFLRLSSLYYFPILMLVALGYFPSGGGGGSIIAIAILIYCTGLIIIRPRYFMMYASFFSILIFCLGAVEYIFPELSEPFGNEKDRIRVNTIANTLLFATLGFCLYYFRREYVFKEKRKQRINEKLIREKNKMADTEKNKSLLLTSVWQEMLPSVSSIDSILIKLNSTGLDETQHQLLGKLSKNNELVTNLLTDLLDIAKPGQQNVLLRNVNFNLGVDLREMIELLESSPLHSDSLFSLNYSKSIPSLLIGDPIRVRQAIGSLIKNSTSAIIGKNITIDVTPTAVRQHECVVSFKLNCKGAGISKKTNADLFNEFYNTEEPNTRSGQEIDPGLKISKNLIEAMGGTIQFTFDDENDFNFYFDLTFSLPENIKK